MNKYFITILLAALLSVSGQALAVSGKPTDSQTVIAVLPSVSVDGDEIRLGDIAKLNAQGYERQMLENISLGRSPRPGKVKVITQRRILSSLRMHQDVLAGKGMDLPDKVYVKRNSQQPDPEAVRLCLKESLSRYFRGKAFTIEELETPEFGQYPVGALSVREADTPRVSTGGRFAVGVEVLVDGHREDRIRMAGRVAVFDTVVVAVKKLKSDTAVSPSDGRLVEVNILNLEGDPAISLEKMRDATLSRDVDEGQVILAKWLEPVPLIHKGDVVTLVAHKENIMIQTYGISREDGFSNSLIEVENMRSGKVVRGVVRKPSTVEVIY